VGQFQHVSNGTILVIPVLAQVRATAIDRYVFHNNRHASFEQFLSMPVGGQRGTVGIEQLTDQMPLGEISVIWAIHFVQIERTGGLGAGTAQDGFGKMLGRRAVSTGRRIRPLESRP
jgi:hypothetical protein